MVSQLARLRFKRRSSGIMKLLETGAGIQELLITMNESFENIHSELHRHRPACSPPRWEGKNVLQELEKEIYYPQRILGLRLDSLHHKLLKRAERNTQ